MLGIGIDIVENSRFHKIRFLERFLSFVMTEREIAVAKEKSDFILYAASRFAAKEAVIKAVPEVITYHDFEIIKNGNKPSVLFSGNYIKYRAAISLSHSPSCCVAAAIVE
jgi:holo-[acyl-carrier protein] synthase